MSLGENRGDVRASAPVRRAAVADLIHTLAVDEDSGVLEQTSMALQILDAKEAIPVLKARHHCLPCREPRKHELQRFACLKA